MSESADLLCSVNRQGAQYKMFSEEPTRVCAAFAGLCKDVTLGGTLTVEDCANETVIFTADVAADGRRISTRCALVPGGDSSFNLQCDGAADMNRILSNPGSAHIDSVEYDVVKRCLTLKGIKFDSEAINAFQPVCLSLGCRTTSAGQLTLCSET